VFRRAARQGGALGNGIFCRGKSKARRYDQEQGPEMIFNDLVGIDGAENELDMVI
jgi:cell division protease FtsH